MFKNCTAEQKNILLSMRSCMELASDIAHAHVTLYLPQEEGRSFKIFCHSEPLTKFVQHQPVPEGGEVRANEEPLVVRSLQRNIIVEGKREYALGQLAAIKVYPVRDGRNHCFAVAAFEAKEPQPEFLDAALVFMRNFDRARQAAACYRRLSSMDGLMLVNKDKQVVAANNTAQHIFRVLGVQNLVGKRTSSLEINWPVVGKVLESGQAEERELAMQGLILNVRFLPFYPRVRAEQSVIIIVEDITELKQKDQELLVKSVVIKEIHHRVKNNLQTIASLLRLQERRAQAAETKLVLRDCINRVNSIAVVHEFLSQQDSGAIDVAKVARGIYEAILSSMVNPGLKLETVFQADTVQLPSEQATSLGLVLNELLQNAVEHGFTKRVQGKLSVSFKEYPDRYVLQIIDDGWGLPPGFILGKTKSLGLKIIQTMVESDLKGCFTLTNGPQGGTVAIVTVPRPEEEA